ncbi:MAG: NAD+ synthase [Candidatus Omnitrophota bacterium]
MKTLRITLAQINSAVGDINGNCQKIINCINKAKTFKSDLIVFPELALSGYPPEDLLLRPKFIQTNRQYLEEVIKATDSIFAIVGFPYFYKYKLFNAAAIIYQKKLIGVYKKMHLPNYGVFDEMRYFKPGDKALVLEFSKGLKIGVNICEDIWQEKGPAQIQSQAGKAKIIINISSSPYFAQKLALRQNLLSKRAKENRCFIAYCNLVGGQDELVFDGASMVFDAKGKLIAQAKQFQEDLLTVDIDIASLTSATRSFRKNLPLEYVNIRAKINDKPNTFFSRKEKTLGRLEEIYAALVLGLKDYCGKNGFRQVVLGLSGGIDSALVVTIAVDALDRDNVVAISMPSMYSSEGTKSDAKKIADNLGIKLHIIPIDSLYKEYLASLRKPFAKTKSNIAEENIQARIRGNILMAFSNKFGSLVVTTGNKSELSTGYCTLYGDTAGGFAILKDVPKTLVYKLARFRNKIEEVIPESIFKRAPSAELKRNQTDQDTLPAYSTLDAIIDLYIEKDKSISDIIKRGFNKNLVKRTASMIDKSEYKRRQYAVGVKITPKAFGRDRRMPITNMFKE